MSLRKILSSEGIVCAAKFPDEPHHMYFSNEPYVETLNPDQISKIEIQAFQKKLFFAIRAKFPGREMAHGWSPTGSPFQRLEFRGLGTGMSIGLEFFQKSLGSWVLRIRCSVGGTYNMKTVLADIPWKGDLEKVYPKVLKAVLVLIKEGLERAAEIRANTGL